MRVLKHLTILAALSCAAALQAGDGAGASVRTGDAPASSSVTSVAPLFGQPVESDVQLVSATAESRWVQSAADAQPDLITPQSKAGMRRTGGTRTAPEPVDMGIQPIVRESDVHLVSVTADLQAENADGSADGAGTDESSAEGDGEAAGNGQQSRSRYGLRPVCVNPCAIDCLDKWCLCEPICGTTDKWCDHLCQDADGKCYLGDDGKWFCDNVCCDVYGAPAYRNTSAVRFGWWGTSNQGSQVKTGEFQDLSASPFWDVDALSTNGQRTLDFTLSGLDNEANMARAAYYGPNGAKADVFYQRFLRRLDHDPMAAPDQVGALPTDNVVSQDLNVGQDYAIRVQQLAAGFQGRVSDNLRWRMNLWGMQKFGERQANSVAHCFNMNSASTPGGTPNPLTPPNRCHVLSQAQNIDWLTMELQPSLEGKYENFSFQYLHTLRSFGQSDETLLRNYTNFGFTAPTGYYNNWAPENMTNIDRLRTNVQLSEGNSLYSNLYVGNTNNDFRDTNRQFGGYDLRLINTSVKDVTWTLYTSMDDENNVLPTSYLTTPPWGTTTANPAQSEPGGLDHPFDYNRTRVGIKNSWIVSGDGYRRLTLVSGYEYYMLARDYATYSSTRLGTFSQPDTKRNMIEVGPNMQWSPHVQSFIRYKGYFYEDPLVGVRESTGRYNTNLPEQDHRIELGGTWTPTSNFMTTAQFTILNRWNDSFYASAVPNTRPINFTQDGYPITVTTWYQPAERVTLSTGYAHFSDWINQDITIGFRTSPLETTPWNYAGVNDLISLSGQYAWSPTITLTGGYEWDHGVNEFQVPPSTAGANWELGDGLASYSRVNVQTQRWTAGWDWLYSRDITAYFRYIMFDFDDRTQDWNSGTSNQFLAGFTWLH